MDTYSITRQCAHHAPIPFSNSVALAADELYQESLLNLRPLNDDHKLEFDITITVTPHNVVK